MPATNLSKITSKTHKLLRSLKDRLWNTREAAWFSSSSAISSFGSLGSLQTPPCISISLPAWRRQGFVILQQHLRNTWSCSPAEVNTQSQQITAPDTEAVDLCQNLKQPDCLIFFFFISFSVDLEKLSQGYGKGPECRRSFHDISNSTPPQFLSYDLTHWEEFLSPSISLQTLPLSVSTKSLLTAM